jgi:hypothetical protein
MPRCVPFFFLFLWFLPDEVARLSSSLTSATAQLETERRRTQDLAATLQAAEDAITLLRGQHDSATKVRDCLSDCPPASLPACLTAVFLTVCLTVCLLYRGWVSWRWS